MTENKRYKRLVSSIDYYYCIDTTNDDKGLTEEDMLNLLNEQDTEIQRLKLIINGLNYALKNIRQIDVEIDLNECGDVE